MAKKTAPRVGLDKDVETLMQSIAVYHGGNLTAAVNYALRLAGPGILKDLQAYCPANQSLKTVATPISEHSTKSPSDESSCALKSAPRRSNAERLRNVRL
jgi:hypothetical protein